MTKSPKYSFRVVEKRNGTWTAEIQRQATAKKKVVSKRETGFATEAEGGAWAEKQLAEILANHVEKNKRNAEQRAKRLLDNPELAAKKAEQKALKKAEKEAKAQQLAKQAAEAELDKDATPEQLLAAAEQAEIAALMQDDEDDELSDKPKFDFEVALEEDAIAEKEEKKKRKQGKKTLAVKANETPEESTEVEDNSQTVDGADEINDIYRSGK
ncbi:DUF3622 domain-containing protein [Thalassotalea crassostreae]|uniref:DUF3622 domain-containing protein n=1 Tax=Thalassotalea crassostreae TaxID=1763536 RepID=UPI0008384AAB|nr:DUF3622 domain-containing protein [Thalassotalea crassostreae]